MNHVENKSKISQRPSIVTFVCLFFGLFGGLAVISLFLIGFIVPELRDRLMQEYGITRLVVSVIPFTFGSIGFIGYWKMRRWGVYFYSATFIISTLLKFIFSEPIDLLGILIPLGIIGVGFAYFNRMT